MLELNTNCHNMRRTSGAFISLPTTMTADDYVFIIPVQHHGSASDPPVRFITMTQLSVPDCHSFPSIRIALFHSHRASRPFAIASTFLEQHFFALLRYAYTYTSIPSFQLGYAVTLSFALQRSGNFLFSILLELC